MDAYIPVMSIFSVVVIYRIGTLILSKYYFSEKEALQEIKKCRAVLHIDGDN
jgi:hypothetical protein